MKNRQPGNIVETGSGEIKIVADTNHIRIRVISIDNRICISAGALYLALCTLDFAEDQQRTKYKAQSSEGSIQAVESSSSSSWAF